MTVRKLWVALLLTGVVGMAVAQQTKVKQVPVRNVDPSSGEKMYVAYCAACHGADGTGNGPAAKALTVPPTNLTLLASKNGGKFPSEQVSQAIRGDASMPSAHGSKDMPMWGGLFSAMCSGSTNNEASMRIGNITAYVKTLQK